MALMLSCNWLNSAPSLDAAAMPQIAIDDVRPETHARTLSLRIGPKRISKHAGSKASYHSLGAIIHRFA